MMSSKNASKCVVHGCKSKGLVCHRFPNPRIHMPRLLEWIKIVGLDNMTPDTVYTTKFICAMHFTSDCSSPGTKRLNANAYPTINLPTINISTSNTIVSPNDLDVVSNNDSEHVLDTSNISGFHVLETSLIDESIIGKL
ncbi:uncharacterized protein LOC115033355 [Acyrthosiphon pisum]|uniref:THAP-type domain-containing protein n=1 Tax=Acyrthosiphon pisum TaxID=7029 RepID=A0A8R2JM16_ACYPI|nr:uncharacterized protein LOC115033355 [Acyrthosiphon pisum]